MFPIAILHSKNHVLYVHMYVKLCTCTCARTYTHIYAYANVHAYTHIYRHIHTHTHKHTHTYTHTNTPVLAINKAFFPVLGAGHVEEATPSFFIEKSLVPPSGSMTNQVSDFLPV